MYYLYICDSEDGKGHYRLAGIFPPSNYWTKVCNETIREYGPFVTYRFHARYS